MDKNTQQRMSLIRERVQRHSRILAGVKAQKDEPDEVLIDRHRFYVNVTRAMHCLVITHFEAITVFFKFNVRSRT